MADEQVQPEEFGADEEVARERRQESEDERVMAMHDAFEQALEPVRDLLQAILERLGGDGEEGEPASFQEVVEQLDERFEVDTTQTGDQIVGNLDVQQMADDVAAIRTLLEQKAE